MSDLRAITEPVTGDGKTPRAVWIFLAVLIAGSFVLAGSGMPAVGCSPAGFWDENVNVQNVSHLLAQGHFEPANGFYPSLAYVPQTLVMAALDAVDDSVGSDRLQFIERGTFTPDAYFVARFRELYLRRGKLAS